MAKVTVIFEDHEDGRVLVAMHAEPAFPATPEEFSSAQVMAAEAVDSLRSDHDVVAESKVMAESN